MEITVDQALLNKAWRELRWERNQLLDDSDKYMISDYPITSEKKVEWMTYRQELRDLPKITEYPNLVSWPIPPR